MQKPTLLVLLVLCLLWQPVAAMAESDRVALVVGNASYRHATQLSNPINDATLIADKLTDLGFRVHLVRDASFEKFTAALRKFETDLKSASTGMFYYAGHGMQFREENFLLATDAAIIDQQDVVTSGKNLNEIIGMMETHVPLSLVFIDACRNNPFADNLRQKLAGRARALGLSRGLAIPEQTANSLVAFATKPNEVALDGDTHNSPFTTALAKHIVTPNIEVSTMLKRVTRDVLEATGHQQRPEVVASMSSEFYFFHNSALVAPVVSYDNDVEREAAATLALKEAVRNNTVIGYRTILEQFPKTAASDVADSLLKELQQEKTSGTSRASQEQTELTVSAQTLLDRMSEASRTGAPLTVASTAPDVIEQSLGLGIEGYRKIQTALNMLGHDAGTEDGVFGAKSRSALREFQIATKIEDTGYVDQKALLQLIKVFEETPKVLDGLWQLQVHRFNQHPEDPHQVNARTHLSSADLRFRDGQFFLLDWTNLAGASRQDDRNPFANFRGVVSQDKKLTLRLEADYLFGKRKVRSVEILGTLPDFVAYGSTLGFTGPRLERNGPKDEMWVRIELKRIPPKKTN
ncbi:caspase family protein [uncultured Roseibium sp.]|uniref:caspase family protein n=1 Tax=uncultured Roseibium sp. TaxID=1936171 RepID=UPI002613B122|nr:caspase family protein [uncultured Roseibium sp.]